MAVRLPAAERRQQLIDTAVTRVRRARLARRVDGRHRRRRGRHEAGAVPTLRVEAGVVPRVARRRRQATARRDSATPPPSRARRASRSSRASPPTSSSSPTITVHSSCCSATGRAATRNSLQPWRASSRSSPTSSPRSINADLDDEHRLLLAHAIVGLAEGASRRWVAAGAAEPANVAAGRVADLAWAGLRAVHR